MSDLTRDEKDAQVADLEDKNYAWMDKHIAQTESTLMMTSLAACLTGKQSSMDRYLDQVQKYRDMLDRAVGVHMGMSKAMKSKQNEVADDS